MKNVNSILKRVSRYNSTMYNVYEIYKNIKKYGVTDLLKDLIGPTPFELSQEGIETWVALESFDENMSRWVNRTKHAFDENDPQLSSTKFDLCSYVDYQKITSELSTLFKYLRTIDVNKTSLTWDRFKKELIKIANNSKIIKKELLTTIKNDSDFKSYMDDLDDDMDALEEMWQCVIDAHEFSPDVLSKKQTLIQSGVTKHTIGNVLQTFQNLEDILLKDYDDNMTTLDKNNMNNDTLHICFTIMQISLFVWHGHHWGKFNWFSPINILMKLYYK